MFGISQYDKAKIRLLEDKVRILENKVQKLDCERGSHAEWEVYKDCCGIPNVRCPVCRFHPNDKKKESK